MWRFEHPEFFIFLVIPLFGWWLHRHYSTWAEQMYVVVNKEAQSERLTKIGKYLAYLWITAATCLALAIPDFRCGKQFSESKSQQTIVLIALDVSTSMLAEDIRPNRISYAKRILSEWITQTPAHVRVGLMTFAGTTQVETPPILDKKFVLQRLAGVEPQQVIEQGTDLSLCFKSAAKLLASQEFTPLVLLVTDAEDHSSGALTTLKAATDMGLAILPIGVGTPQGAPVPSGQSGTAYLKDDHGSLVRSARNDALLKKIAESGGTGTFLIADGSTNLTSEIENIRKKYETGALMTYRISDYISRYIWFVLPAVIALIALIWCRD